MQKNIFLTSVFTTLVTFALPSYAGSGTASNVNDSQLHVVKVDQQTTEIGKWVKVEKEGDARPPQVYCFTGLNDDKTAFTINENTIDRDVALGIIKQPLPGFPLAVKYTFSQCNNAGCSESKPLDTDTFKVSAIVDSKYSNPVYKYIADPKVFVLKAFDPKYGKDCRWND